MSVVPLPPEFRLERYFSQHEFTAKHLLCCSDAESLSMKEVLDMADEKEKEMWSSLTLGYTESQGLVLLRDRIAETFYPGLNGEHILIGAPQELIYMAMRCIASPGDHVIAPFPAYQSLYANLTSIGCDVGKWEPTLVENEENVKNSPNGGCKKCVVARWRFSLADLRRLVKPETKVLVVNFPHNPTGAVLDPKEYEELVEFCREKRISLFCDEMYQYLKDDCKGNSNNLDDDGSNLPSHVPACVVYEKATTLCGLSKSFSLPGLRIGWLASKDFPLMKKMKSFKDYLSICSSAPSEVLGLIAVRNAPLILGCNRLILAHNLPKLVAFFAKWPLDFVFPRGSAGTTTFVKIISDGPLARSLKRMIVEGKIKLESDEGDSAGRESSGRGIASAFCSELLRRKNVLLLPAAEYDGFRDDYFRLSLARKDMDVGLAEWTKFMDEIHREGCPEHM